jgi:hypothetical protein
MTQKNAVRLIRHLDQALALADEIQDGHTGYLIERALDRVRALLSIFKLIRKRQSVLQVADQPAAVICVIDHGTICYE